MATSRLFVALLPPPTVSAELAALAEPLAGVRWVPAEDSHLTLRFIGDAPEERREAFGAALERVRVEPFILPAAGLGVFPPRGAAKVLWAGVGRAHPRLFQLRKQVDEALLRVDPGLAMPSFHPHFTVGRIGDAHAPKELAAFLERNGGFEAPPFRVDAFHLMTSTPAAGRASRYEVVRRFPLAP
ncbi:MAG: RNA 2',3'-cyclic phosphodiesterase [Opitutaceae bacterium]|nr:RNA 2',3'-cyclic phosphodiesterase [Opitutaceae bacterium]